MNLNQYTKQRDDVASWATPERAGQARLAWMDAITDRKLVDPNTPAVTIDFGRATHTINVSGAQHEVEVNTDPEIGRMSKVAAGVHVATAVPLGAAPTNKMIGSMRIPCGVCLIVAGGDAGKTPLAHAIAGADGRDYEVVRYGEPLAGYLADERLGAISLASALFNSADVVLDSVKDVLALASGGAMKAGISRGALPLLSRWGSIAAAMGSTLYIPLNPSSADDEVIALLVEAAKSNATMAIFAESANSWKFVARRGEGLRRDAGEFKTRFTGDGLMEIGGADTSTRADGLNGDIKTVAVSDIDYSASIRRAMQVVPQD